MVDKRIVDLPINNDVLNVVTDDTSIGLDTFLGAGVTSQMTTRKLFAYLQVAYGTGFKVPYTSFSYDDGANIFNVELDAAIANEIILPLGLIEGFILELEILTTNSNTLAAPLLQFTVGGSPILTPAAVVKPNGFAIAPNGLNDFEIMQRFEPAFRKTVLRYSGTAWVFENQSPQYFYDMLGDGLINARANDLIIGYRKMDTASVGGTGVVGDYTYLNDKYSGSAFTANNGAVYLNTANRVLRHSGSNAPDAEYQEDATYRVRGTWRTMTGVVQSFSNIITTGVFNNSSVRYASQDFDERTSDNNYNKFCDIDFDNLQYLGSSRIATENRGKNYTYKHMYERI